MPDAFGLPTALLTSVGGVEVDATLSEGHNYNALVTENPVEDGSVVTDHIVNLPVVLEMEGRFSDTPFGFLASLLAGTAGLAATALGTADIVAGLSTAAVAGLLGESSPGLSKTKFNLLVALQVTREPIEIVTGLTTYSNMAIEALKATRSSADGKSIRFTATFREIKIVGDNATTNRQRVVEDLWGRVLDPRLIGIVSKAQASFSPIPGIT